MENQTDLRVRLSADLDDIKKGMALLRGDFAKLKKDAAGATPSTAGWRQGLADVRTQLAGVVSLYAVMRGARWYLDQADQAANLSAKLRLATKSQDEFTKAQQATYAIAQRTSAEWGSVVGLYAQLAQTTGMGQERILALTETISQAFQVSGASAEETSNGLRQLQQAMAGGVLRAEEFNTIIETSPRIVQAMADYFGIAFGDVRKYVNDGKVSSEQFAQALLKGSADIQRDFDKLPLTVSRATQQVRNALLGLVGDADSASGASNDLATGIQDLARTLESPEVKQGFATFVGGVVTATKKLAELLSTTANVTKFIAEELAARLHGPNADDLVRLSDAIKRDEERLQAMYRPGTARGHNNVVNTEGYAQRYAELERRLATNKANYEAALAAASRPVAEPGVTNPEPDSPDPTLVTPTKVIAKSNALMRDTVSRALAELERLYKGNEVSLEEYFATRQRLAEQAIDLEIEQARNELAVTKDLGARRKLEEQITILQRDRAEVAATAAQEQKAAEEDLEKALAGVTLRLKELRGESVSVERAKLETEFQELKNLLRKNGREAGVAMVDELIDGLVNKARSDEMKEAASRISSALQGKETSISAQTAAGMMSGVEGERQLGLARQQALQEYQQLRAEAQAYLLTLDPASAQAASAQAFLQSLNTDIANIVATQNQLRQDIGEAGAGALNNLFSNISEGAMTASELVKQLALDFAQSLFDMQARALANKAGQALSSLFGKGEQGGGVDQGAVQLASAATTTALAGGVIQTGAAALSVSAASLLAAAQALMVANAMSTVSAGVAHTGAKVGQWTMRRTVSPLVFGAAPRYHSGGIAGLKPDEVPAILQTGERVLSRRQTAAYDAAVAGASGSGGAGVVTTPIVAIGDDAVANALAGAAGERVVMTHVRNNMEAIQRGG